MTRSHILVIEPDPFVASTIGILLESVDFRVTAVHDGSAAREFLNGDGRRCDAVILAFVLAGEDGASLAEHVRQLGLPLVMISGSDRAMNSAADSGMQLLCKPFGREALLAEVRSALTSGIAGWRKASFRDFDHRETRIGGSSGFDDFASKLARAWQWRMKAEELRTIADQMTSPRAQSIHRLAETYDALAESYERDSKQNEKSG